MVADPRLARVHILVQQQRFGEAQRILRELLAETPDNVAYLATLGQIQLETDQLEASERTINQAIGQDPGNALLLYLKSQVKMQQNDYGGAQQLLEEAVAIYPLDADFYAMQAQVLLLQKEYQAALKSADQALSVEPENLLALNMRSKALIKLDRKEDSYKTIQGALREDPHNAYTHSNYGWGLLETGDHRKAQEHFAQSLRANPNDPYARSGMAEALKAKNPVYRLFLQYAFFMEKLTAKYQWGVIIGFYVLYRLLRGLAASNPTLQPVLNPVLILLAIVALSTWVIGPLGDLFLRFDRHGRYLLDERETRTADLVTISLAICGIGLLGYLLVGQDPYLVLAAYGFSMILPLSFYFARAKTTSLLKVYCFGLGIVGALAVVTAFGASTFNVFTVVYLLGFFLYQWVANYQVIRN